MHVVVRFDGPEIARRASRSGVRLLGTAEYYSGPAVPHEFILRFSGLSEKALVEAVRRMAE